MMILHISSENEIIHKPITTKKMTKTFSLQKPAWKFLIAKGDN